MLDSHPLSKYVSFENDYMDTYESSIQCEEGIQSENNILGKLNNTILYQENKGQITDTDGNPRPDILFTSYANGVRTYFKKDGISYVFEKHNIEDKEITYSENGTMPNGTENVPEDFTIEMHRIDLNLVGTSDQVSIVTSGQDKVFDNFYLGDIRAEHVYSYEKVTYKNIYPNIDMILYTKNGGMKYDFIVRPGGNPDVIQFEIDGTTEFNINNTGDLVIKSHLGEIIEGAPLVFQESKTIKSNYVLNGNILSFNFEDYNPNKTLIIDPTRAWGTYYTASNGQHNIILGMDEAANTNGVFWAINTNATSYPVSPGVFDPTFNGNYDIRIVHFNTNGNLVWGTYFGGTSTEASPAIAEGPGNTFVLSGATTSPNLPVTGNTHDQTINGSYDYFLSQWRGFDGTLRWSTYFGGPGQEWFGHGVDVNSSGEIAFYGTVQNTSMPIVNGLYPTYIGGTTDNIVAKFNSLGGLVWSSYFGGNNYDVAHRHGIKFDNNNNIIIKGRTNSVNLPTTAGVFKPTNNGVYDFYLASFTNNGQALNYCTYIGDNYQQGFPYFSSQEGAERDWSAIAICSDNSVIVGGVTWDNRSNAWAYTPGSFSSNYFGAFDSFILKFNTSGQRIWGTTWGGNSNDWLIDVDVDEADNVFVLTGTYSYNMPTTGDRHQGYTGHWEKHIAQLSADGSTLLYSSYLGTNDYDMPEVGGLAYHAGSLYCGFVTRSTSNNPSWIVSSGAYQTSPQSGSYYPVLNKFLFDVPVTCNLTSVTTNITDATCTTTDDGEAQISINFTSAPVAIEGSLDGGNNWIPLGTPGSNPFAFPIGNLAAGSYSITIREVADTSCEIVTPFTIGVQANATDSDGDGVSVEDCDCDDNDDTVFPGADELCDGIDNNCDGDIDENALPDAFLASLSGTDVTLIPAFDANTFNYSASVCNTITETIISATASNTLPATNVSGDGYASLSEGLNTITITVEACGTTQDYTIAVTRLAEVIYYADTDNDGFGNANDAGTPLCSLQAGYATNNQDCDDTNDTVYPGAPEINCDGLDNDCIPATPDNNNPVNVNFAVTNVTYGPVTPLEYGVDFIAGTDYTFASAGNNPGEVGGNTWVFTDLILTNYGGLWFTFNNIENPRHSSQAPTGSMVFQSLDTNTGVATFYSTAPLTWTNPQNGQPQSVNTQFRMQIQPVGATGTSPMSAGVVGSIPNNIVDGGEAGLPGLGLDWSTLDVSQQGDFQVWFAFEVQGTNQPITEFYNNASTPPNTTFFTSVYSSFFAADDVCVNPGNELTVTAIPDANNSAPFIYTFNDITNATGVFSGITAGTFDYSIMAANGCLTNGTHTVGAPDLSFLLPIPDVATLPDVNVECEVTSLTAPTATDVCGGTTSATTDTTLPITTLGTTIVTWTYTNGNGDTVMQTQNVVIADSTPPSITCTNINATTDFGQCDANLTIVSPIVSDNCQNGNGLDFDGVDDFVSIGNVGNAQTIEFWMYSNSTIDGTGDYDMIFNFNNSDLIYIATNGVTSSISGETLSVVTAGGGGILSIKDVLPAGWNHIAITSNGSIYNNIYLNGNVSTTYSAGGNTNVITINSAFIGQRPSSPLNRFEGRLDELRFWNVSRSPSEIQSNFNNELTAQSGLIGLYHFNEGVANSDNNGVTVAADTSGNGNNGTLNNFALSGCNSNWISGFNGITLTNDLTNSCDASGIYPIGLTTITWTATDASGNQTTCEQQILVESPSPVLTSINPVNFSPGDQVVIEGNFFTDIDNVVTMDGTNAPIVSQNATSITITVPADICSGDVLVSNACALTSIASLPYTIDAPTITNVTPDILPVEGGATIVIDGTNFSASGNMVTIGGQAGINIQNESATSITVISPANICNGDIIVTSACGATSLAYGYTVSNPIISSINTSSVIPNNTLLISGANFNPGQNSVTINGNNATITSENYNEIEVTVPFLNNACIADIVVTTCNLVSDTFTSPAVESELPTISCPADISAVATSAAGAIVTYTEPVGSDNCGIVSTNLTTSLGSGDTFPIGNTVVTYMTTDTSGNTETCSFTVSVVGVAPVAVCPNEITQNTDAGLCSAVVNFSATDEVGIPASTISYSQDPNTVFPVGTTTVTVTATNAVGSSTCTFDVVVVDSEGPTFNCPTNIVVTLDDAGNGTLDINDYTLNETDNCSTNLSVSVSQTAFTCADIPSGGSAAPPSVWINEFHYDNSGSDVGEFVEVAGTAGLDLTGYSIVFYNGNGGSPYSTINLSGSIDDEGNGYGAVSFSESGIQNGAPDGIALADNNGNLIEFISYEGSFTGSGGPANGVTSTDVGV
ncbi:DUF7948 domain-containing protein, partial [Xanthomarina spongicola]